MVRIVAHRGASGLVEVENSLEAFEEAIRLGVDMVEFDVRRTADGEWVCFHDAELMGEPLDELTYSEVLRRSHAPRVEEAVRLCRGRIGLDVELKEFGYEREVVSMVRRLMPPGSFVVKSFHDRSVRLLKAWDSRLTVGLLLGLGDPENVVRTRISELFPERRIRSCKPDFVSPNHQLLRAGFLRRMRRLRLPVWVWTVNESDLMQDLLRRGVDALITDYPDRALALLSRSL